MTKGYAIFNEDISDQAAYDKYAQKAVPTILERGGKLIVVNDGPEVIEGEWKAPRVIVVEFESVEAARDWYHSPEYQSIVGERHAAAEADAVIVDGFELPET